MSMDTTINIYDAKAGFSRIVSLVEAGQRVIIARAGKPVVDIVPHVTAPKIKFGILKGKIKYKQSDFEGIDPEISKMFYGE
jgi:antitoxin (DNA-binding transcriptional repressor) of toxin-antitoxin stability system